MSLCAKLIADRPGNRHFEPTATTRPPVAVGFLCAELYENVVIFLRYNMAQPDEDTDVNEDFFAEPNSHMAYVLGLAMSGGHIGEKKCGQEFLSIRSIEKDLLEMVNVLMKSKYEIYDSCESEAGHTVWSIDVDNEKVVADAKRWGVSPTRTYITKLPELPVKYHADFIRGLFARIAVAAERNLFDVKCEQGSEV